MFPKKEVLVLDSPAFISGVNISSVEIPLFTTPEVINEISSIWLKLKYSTSIQLRVLNIVSPKLSFLKEAEKASIESGDKKKLSKADFSVLAMALELNSTGFKPLILSDDYSIQNVADILNLNYENLAIRKIRSRIKWVWYCPACKKRFSSAEIQNICSVCGTSLKRKASKKTILNE